MAMVKIPLAAEGETLVGEDVTGAIGIVAGYGAVGNRTHGGFL
jgi:hypothetical protein